MQKQTKLIWNKRIISEVLKKQKNNSLDEPFYRIFCELRKTEYASRPKYINFVDIEGNESEDVIVNNRHSFFPDSKIARDTMIEYPKKELFELLGA